MVNVERRRNKLKKCVGKGERNRQKNKIVHRGRDKEKEKERIRQTRKMAHKKEREI